MTAGFLNMKMETKTEARKEKPLTEIVIKVTKYDILKMSRTLELNMKEGDVQETLKLLNGSKDQIVKNFLLAKIK